jgi:DNA/RNA endonuclease YhcR with UshA esterase domain
MARRLFSIATVGGFLLAAVPMFAHHSLSAEFDTNKPITFTGAVKQVEWGNPHIYTEVEAKDETGKLVVFRVEGSPPNELYRQGFRKDSVKVGEIVTVKGIRAKSPTSYNIGSATITKADGSHVYGR